MREPLCPAAPTQALKWAKGILERYFSRSSERGAGGASGRLHVKAHVFDVARFIEAHQALGEGFDLVF